MIVVVIVASNGNDRHFHAPGTAEQFVNGFLLQLAEPVPERDVHEGEGLLMNAVPAHVQVDKGPVAEVDGKVSQFAVQLLDILGAVYILSEQILPELFVDERDNALLFHVFVAAVHFTSGPVLEFHNGDNSVPVRDAIGPRTERSDHLGVRKVGNGIQGDVRHGVVAGQDGHGDKEEDDELVVGTVFDDRRRISGRRTT